jgi:hypothetical protein
VLLATTYGDYFKLFFEIYMGLGLLPTFCMKGFDD